MLSITDGESCVGTVGREWAAPLGIPTIFLYDALTSGDISAGGGQLYSCRDAARVGQLIASGGMWYAPTLCCPAEESRSEAVGSEHKPRRGRRKDAEGKPMRMMSPAFAKGFVQPSFPEINPAYGFLTW